MTFFLTGTDTDVGKTVAAAWAMLHLHAAYWKPIQCGTDDGTDAETIQKLTNCSAEMILPSTYVLPEPLSPHEAAKRAGQSIKLEDFSLPAHDGPVIVEGAGGLMVPLNGESFVIDLIGKLGLPVILVCRSTLGTINHTLLSLIALRLRKIDVAGAILSGPKSPHNRQAIESYGGVRVIAEIPQLQPLTREALLHIKPEFDLAELASS